MMPAEFLQLARNFSESLGGGAQSGTVLKPTSPAAEQLNGKAGTPELPDGGNDDIALKTP